MKFFTIGAALSTLVFLPSSHAAQPAAAGQIAAVVTISDAQHRVVESYSESNVIDGKPSVFENMRDTSFVQSASNTPAGVKLSPGVVHTGWASSISSKTSKGGVVLRISISQSSLQGMRSIKGEHGLTVQLPSVDTKSTTASIFLPDGKGSVTVVPLWRGLAATITAKQLTS